MLIEPGGPEIHPPNVKKHLAKKTQRCLEVFVCGSAVLANHILTKRLIANYIAC